MGQRQKCFCPMYEKGGCIEDKKTENMIAIEATTKNKVGFDTYA